MLNLTREKKRNVVADRRANSLKLNPRSAQTNGFRHFVMPERLQEIDLVRAESMARVREICQTGRARKF